MISNNGMNGTYLAHLKKLFTNCQFAAEHTSVGGLPLVNVVACHCFTQWWEKNGGKAGTRNTLEVELGSSINCWNLCCVTIVFPSSPRATWAPKVLGFPGSNIIVHVMLPAPTIPVCPKLPLAWFPGTALVGDLQRQDFFRGSTSAFEPSSKTVQDARWTHYFPLKPLSPFTVSFRYPILF